MRSGEYLGMLSAEEIDVLLSLKDENTKIIYELAKCTLELEELQEREKALEEKKKDLEEKKKDLILKFKKELPEREEKFQKDLSDRLGTSKWEIGKDWTIYG